MRQLRRPITRLTMLAALAVGLCTACESDNQLGGVWRQIAPATGDLVISPAEGFSAVGVELVLGHYGPDVAGVIRFYRRDNFESSRDPYAPARQCACTYLRQGRWSGASDRLTFSLKGCLPGEASQQSLYTLGDFLLVDDPQVNLAGTLTVEEPNSPLYGRQQSWQFERVSSVSASDLTCPTIEDSERGNTANGR